MGRHPRRQVLRFPGENQPAHRRDKPERQLVLPPFHPVESQLHRLAPIRVQDTRPQKDGGLAHERLGAAYPAVEALELDGFRDGQHRALAERGVDVKYVVMATGCQRAGPLGW